MQRKNASAIAQLIVPDDDRSGNGINPKDKAYAWLKEQLVIGKLPFGAVLSPRRIGLEIGMSFLPISDALRRLESEGLVESKDRVGTRVRIPTVEDIRGIYAIREALESQAARFCCERATKAQRTELRRLGAEVDAQYEHCGRISNVEEMRRTNIFHVNFHRLIADAAHCPLLREAIDKSNVLTMKIQFDNALRSKKRPKNWHRNFIKRVLGPDPVEADLAAREHIRYGMDDVLKALELLQIDLRWRS